jgi:hypothetical protein
MYGRTDRQIDMAKLIVTFRNFANIPKSVALSFFTFLYPNMSVPLSGVRCVEVMHANIFMISEAVSMQIVLHVTDK